MAAIAGYLLGSISFAVLIARSRGVDIFKVGSGNPGATNVLRSLGKTWGYLCFLLDAFKGVASVLIGFGLAESFGGDPEYLAVVALLFAILGHSFSLFLRFRGGKGVATTIGGLLALMPLVFLFGAILWLIVFYTTRYVSLASLVLGASLPVSAWLFNASGLGQILCLALAILIAVRHRSNIQRLLNGTENRAGGK
ncbi:MAG: glycerol-3-phosphate 1-O-acyltransferase PlsY [Opitutales bacterium]|nr:glycerol-3-phosphate 1-O-acyltransferase PlsY [Opitutales bacterium]